MTKELIIDTFRTIKKTFGKFFTLFAIVTLGVAFFVGVSAAAPIMGYSVDTYNDEYQLMDIQIFSNYGFEENDVVAVEKSEGILAAEGTKFVDVFAKYANNDIVARIHNYDSKNKINQFDLKEGKLPQGKNECLVEKGGSLYEGISIGDKIKFSRPKNDLDDFLDVTGCTVVGLITTPEYINEEKGNSTLNNRSLSKYIYLSDDAFSMDYYTTIVALVDGAIDYGSFTADYFDFVQPTEDKLEVLATTQSKVRQEKIVKEANEEYNDGLIEYNDGKKEFDDEIAKAERDIRKAKQDLIDGQKEIVNGEEEIVTNQATLDKEVADATITLDDAQFQLESGLVTWKAEKAKFDNETKPALVTQKSILEEQYNPLSNALASVQALLQKESEIEATINILQIRIEQLNKIPEADITEEQKTELAEKKETKNVLDTQLATVKQSISGVLTQLNVENVEQLVEIVSQLQSGIKQIDDGIAMGEKKINEAKSVLDSSFQQVWGGKEELERTKVESQQKLDDARNDIIQAKKDLQKGKTELADAEVEFEKEKADGQKELDDAWADLVKAKDDIDNLEKGEWTVLDRDLHYGSRKYHDTIKQMKAIASIFPVFFILVSALVCLTTMTRMVDEQRGQIGTLRALGYGRLACASKYLIYAGIATILGGVAGSIVGMMVFPAVIYSAWSMMYVLPPIKIEIPWNLIILANVMFMGLMLLTTWMASRQEMNEVTSQLLRPKAPPMGKKIILEKIPFIWKRFSFTSKVTARNIIRYKKRFFMTVIGIAGCTALLVAGFGIKGSISAIVNKQFGDIYKYAGFVSLKDDLKLSEIISIDKEIKENKDVIDTTLLTTYSSKVYVGNQEEVVSVEVYDDSEEMFLNNNIRHRKDDIPIVLADDTVIISEKLSELLNLKVNDTIRIESENEIVREFVVGDICEMYVEHHIYISAANYENTFGIKANPNAIQIIANEDTDIIQENLASIDGIESFNFYKPVIENFNSMIQGLDIVVVVLIVSAGLLAFVVLSNLTNVNISERQREIATLKVLGFNRKEINMYIYKENLILTFIGSLVGLVLGIMLHRFVILMVEMDFVMFGRDVSSISLIYSVLITMGFALMVNYAMTFKLRKIKMVESLKSVE